MTNGMTVGARFKLVARASIDRIVRPYFSEQSAQFELLAADIRAASDGTDEPATAQATPILADFNLLLHELRTVELSRVPRPQNVMLSAGCSDVTFFEWVSRALGPIPEHWGVELYRPEPENLPDRTRWITASASSMPQVPDGSVDVLFSGQNIEHLSRRDIFGFLRESYRVLREGGLLVVDSPNRIVTQALGWRHPEHVVELSPAEAVALIERAGFEVIACRGLWCCQERDGTWLPLMPEGGDVSEFLRRAVHAGEAPERSFCWWIEARASRLPVDEIALRAEIEQLFEVEWPRRVNRGASGAGQCTESGWEIPAEAIGSLYRIGPIPIFAGGAVIDVQVEPRTPLAIRVSADDGRIVAEGPAPLELTLPQTEFGLWVDVIRADPHTGPIHIKGVDVDADL